MEKELIKNENEEVLTIDSREIAEMMEKEHSKLLRDIRTYSRYIAEANLGLGKYFIESKYIDSNNQERPNYLVTKMGCEICANKMTGKKGILFTVKYVDKFNKMEGQIRKTNTYKLPQTFSEALRQLADKWDENNKLIEENKVMKPKSDFYDKVTESETTFNMNDSAKILNYKGMGRNKLFAFLREQNVLMIGNRPYQRYVDAGYFKEVESEFVKNDEVVVNYKTVVFQKGLDYISKLLDKNGYVINKKGIKSKENKVIKLIEAEN